jgi:hypothetical protein
MTASSDGDEAEFPRPDPKAWRVDSGKIVSI